MKKWWTKSTLERIMNTWCHFNAIWARNKLYYFTSSCVSSLTSRTNEKKNINTDFKMCFENGFYYVICCFGTGKPDTKRSIFIVAQAWPIALTLQRTLLVCGMRTIHLESGSVWVKPLKTCQLYTVFRTALTFPYIVRCFGAIDGREREYRTKKFINKNNNKKKRTEKSFGIFCWFSFEWLNKQFVNCLLWTQ